LNTALAAKISYKAIQRYGNIAKICSFNRVIVFLLLLIEVSLKATIGYGVFGE